MAAGLYAPREGEMAKLMSEQVLCPWGNCVKSGEWRFALDTRL